MESLLYMMSLIENLLIMSGTGWEKSADMRVKM